MHGTNKNVIVGAAAAIVVALQNAEAVLDAVHERLAADVHEVYRTESRHLPHRECYELNLECERDVFHLRDDIHAELVELITTLNDEYAYAQAVQHKVDVMELDAPDTISISPRQAQSSEALTGEQCANEIVVIKADTICSKTASSVSSSNTTCVASQPKGINTASIPQAGKKSAYFEPCLLEVSWSRHSADVKGPTFRQQYEKLVQTITVLVQQLADINAHLDAAFGVYSDFSEPDAGPEITHLGLSSDEDAASTDGEPDDSTLTTVLNLIKQQELTSSLLKAREAQLKKIEEALTQLRRLLSGVDSYNRYSSSRTLGHKQVAKTDGMAAQIKASHKQDDTTDTMGSRSLTYNAVSTHILAVLQDAQQRLSAVTAEHCLPNKLIKRDSVHNLSDRVELPASSPLTSLLSPLLLALHYEESLPSICGLGIISEKQVLESICSRLQNARAAESGHVIADTSLPCLKQYIEKDSLRATCSSILSKLRQLRTVWEDALELYDERNAYVAKTTDVLQSLMSKISNIVTSYAKEGVDTLSGLLFYVFGILQDASVTATDAEQLTICDIGRSLTDFISMHSTVSCSVDIANICAIGTHTESSLDAVVSQFRTDTVSIEHSGTVITWSSSLHALILSRWQKQATLSLNSAVSPEVPSVFSTWCQRTSDDTVKKEGTRIELSSIMVAMWEQWKAQKEDITTSTHDAVVKQQYIEQDLQVSNLIHQPTKKAVTFSAAVPTEHSHYTHSVHTSAFKKSTSTSLDTSLIVCKIAQNLSSSDADSRNYVKALEMSHYSQLHNSSAASSNVLSVISSIKGSHSMLTESASSGAASRSSTAVQGCPQGTLDTFVDVVLNSDIYHFDNNYRELYVVKTLVFLSRAEMRMLEYIYGYTCIPRQIHLQCTGKKPSQCDVHIPKTLAMLVFKRSGIVIHSISSRALISVSDKVFGEWARSVRSGSFPLVISAGNRGDCMLLFDELRGATVFRVGLQTMLRHRSELPRLAAISRSE